MEYRRRIALPIFLAKENLQGREQREARLLRAQQKDNAQPIRVNRAGEMAKQLDATLPTAAQILAAPATNQARHRFAIENAQAPPCQGPLAHAPFDNPRTGRANAFGNQRLPKCFALTKLLGA